MTRFWTRIRAFLECLVGPCPVCGALSSLDGDEGDGLDGLCLHCGNRYPETSTPEEAEWMKDGASAALVDQYSSILHRRGHEVGPIGAFYRPTRWDQPESPLGFRYRRTEPGTVAAVDGRDSPSCLRI